MAEVKTYAEVSAEQAHAAGGHEAGRASWTAKTLLARAGDEDFIDAPLGPVLTSHLLALAEITGDESYRRIADGVTVKVAIGHLRGLHPDTAVRFGVALHYTPEEARALRLRGLT